MKRFSVIAAITVLSLGAAVIVTPAAAQATIVNISEAYSKSRLEAVCAQEGGNAWGGAGGAYGCTKGNNTVACTKTGSCKGFMWLQPRAVAGANHAAIRNWSGSAALVLQMPSTPAKSGLDGKVSTAQ